MSITKLVILIFLICLNSCTPKVISLKDNDCFFDKENLQVSSSNSNDTVFYINNLGYALAFQYLEFGNINCVKTNYNNVSKEDIWLKTFSISNIGCKDTLWAKKKINEELKSMCKFDYSFSDSFCIRKYYNIKLVDSSLLVKSSYNREDLSGKISGNFDDWYILHDTEYKDIGDYLLPKPFNEMGCCGDYIGNMLDTLSGKYDLKIYSNIYEQLGEAAHIKIIRDSLGFDVKWLKDEVVPLKVITYRKKILN
jgi:hypothetical protein